jgi:hypothetical protein
MIESIPLPGLTGKTVVVLDAADGHGPAVCGSLIASGVTVIATGASAALPTELVDAGTGLDGELHYHQLTDWAATAEWIATHAEKISGIVGASGSVSDAAKALVSRLDAGAAIVTVGAEGEPAAGGGAGIRMNTVVLAGGRGSLPRDVGAVVALLFSNLTARVDGARIPVGERPADKI